MVYLSVNFPKLLPVKHGYLLKNEKEYKTIFLEIVCVLTNNIRWWAALKLCNWLKNCNSTCDTISDVSQVQGRAHIENQPESTVSYLGVDRKHQFLYCYHEHKHLIVTAIEAFTGTLCFAQISPRVSEAFQCLGWKRGWILNRIATTKNFGWSVMLCLSSKISGTLTRLNVIIGTLNHHSNKNRDLVPSDRKQKLDLLKTFDNVLKDPAKSTQPIHITQPVPFPSQPTKTPF